MPRPLQLGFGLIHGGFHGAWCWSEVVRRLAWPCAAVDLPGRTGSREQLAGITYEDWVQSATVQIGALAVDRLVIVAHSLGGITLPAVAERLSDKVRHCVFIAAVMPPEGRAFADLGHIAEAADGVWPKPPSEALERSLCNDMPPGSIDGLWPKLAQAEPLGPLRHAISRRTILRTPVTFIRALRDVTGCLGDLDAGDSPLRAEFPDATIEHVEAGHSLIMTAPDEVARLLTRIGKDVLRAG
ncbi:MAG: alpha/beta hydrolase fold protein [Phenylobacterium sp.]|uniref:alpha/beta fold hydrolase n=1 Tax=Phenylobacterium sp. TaxID=1871053 RepID=UPI0026230CAA|nr:alpha/beta fold hydrolase [Phenylobacterium sp.]MDB5497304.1 alpha/beta hydrolase fold protein [Phenylobacterium sp.]